MGLCSCLASCLVWGIQHWSLLAAGWSCVLVLRQRSLRELLPVDATWSQEVSGGPMSWPQLSHLGGSSLTPSWSTKTLSASRLSVHCSPAGSVTIWGPIQSPSSLPQDGDLPGAPSSQQHSPHTCLHSCLCTHSSTYHY